MATSMPIKYLINAEIDKAKWDACIVMSVNCLIYARSFCLDAMADNWDGIVIGDYEAVVPLCWRKKYFIRYLYQPPFLQQSGIFYTSDLNTKDLTNVEGLIKKHFKYAAIQLNYANKLLFEEDMKSKCTNYILDLSKHYASLSEEYKSGFAKNVKRSRQFNLHYKTEDDFLETINLYKNLYGIRFTHVKEKNYQNFSSLCRTLVKKNMLLIRKVVNAENELLAVALFFKDGRRIYNVMSCITNTGRDKEANYFLYDNLIQEFANTNLMLDFEGSDIKGVADFYQSTGAVNQSYYFMAYNHLPWPLKLFK